MLQIFVIFVSILLLSIIIIKADPIVFGDIVETYPFAVFVDITSEEHDEKGNVQKYVSDCGGTIIKETAILTAAHCLTKSLTEPKLRIFAGALHFEDFGEIAQQRTVDDFIIHDDFDEDNLVDIAILRLRRPLSLEMGAVEIADLGESQMNTYATSIGWGTIEEADNSRELRQIKVKIVSKQQCKRFYKDSDRVVCAWADNRKSTPCLGDSGSPLVYNRKVIGITAKVLSMVIVKTKDRIHNFCHADKPSVYVDVSKFIKWIKNHFA